MNTIFYRSAIYACALAGLAACSRASYQLTAPAPLSAAAVLPRATPDEAPRAVCRTRQAETTVAIEAAKEAPRATGSTRAPLPACPTGNAASFRHNQPPIISLSYQANNTLPKISKPRAVRPVANYGPYFGGPNFEKALLLLALCALLFAVLITGAVALLVKLIVSLTRGKSRRSTAPPSKP